MSIESCHKSRNDNKSAVRCKARQEFFDKFNGCYSISHDCIEGNIIRRDNCSIISSISSISHDGIKNDPLLLDKFGILNDRFFSYQIKTI